VYRFCRESSFACIALLSNEPHIFSVIVIHKTITRYAKTEQAPIKVPAGTKMPFASTQFVKKIHEIANEL